MSFDPVDVLGAARNEMGSKFTLLPESYYPMLLVIGSEPGVGDDKEDAVINKKTGETGFKPGSVYVELTGRIQDANCPFVGSEVTRRYYASPWITGGGWPMLRGATLAITGKEPDGAAFQKFGIVIPSQEPGEAERAYRERAQRAAADQYGALSPADRLAFMIQYLRLAKWNGVEVIAKVRLEERHFRDEAGVEQVRHDNSWGGFYALGDKKRGMTYVATVEYPQQKVAKEQMDAQAV